MPSLLKKALKPIFKTVAKIPMTNPHFGKEIQLMVEGSKPTCIIEPKFDLTEDKNLSDDRNHAVKKMKTMISSGEILLIGKQVFGEREVHVYAQANKAEMGKELFNRYYEESSDYPEFQSWQEWFERIGKLLGYSDTDIKRYKIKGLASKVLDKTHYWRRGLREEYNIK